MKRLESHNSLAKVPPFGNVFSLRKKALYFVELPVKYIIYYIFEYWLIM